MSDRTADLEVGEVVRVIAATRSGDIGVVNGEAGAVKVAISGGGADDYEIDQVGDVITIEPRRKGRFLSSSADIGLVVPVTANLELSCTSGDILVQGSVAEARASVASGDVRIEAVTDVCRVNSASGDIRIASAGDAEINTASGTVRLGRVERGLLLNAASGNVDIEEVGEFARCKVASSDVRIKRFEGTELRHKTMSGDLHVGIPPHRTVDLDFSSMSGRLRNKLPKGDGSPSEKSLSISVAAVSGDLTLRGA